MMATANRLVEEMSRMPQLVAPRVSGDLQRPEIIIRPRLDLAAELGVTTAALSQTIRIATQGEIDQNSARFSLSDRQIPIRVSLNQDARQRLSRSRISVPTTTGGSVPLKVIAEIGFGSGPTRIERSNQLRRVTIGADLAPNMVSGDAYRLIRQTPTMSNLPPGVREIVLGQNKWQQEMITNFLIALVSGIFLVFAVLMLLYQRVLPPFVNMGSLLRRIGRPQPVMTGMGSDAGLERHFDAARKSSQTAILRSISRAREMGKGVKYGRDMDAGTSAPSRS